MSTIRTFDQWWTEIENFAMRGERLSDMLSKSALAQVAYDEGVAAALSTQPQAPQGAVMEFALEALDDESPYGRFLAQRLLRNALDGIMPCPICKGQGGGEEWIANENDRSGQSDYRAWVDCKLCNPNTPAAPETPEGKK